MTSTQQAASVRTIGILLAIVLANGPLSVCGDVDYLRDVKPLLAEKCFACHGPLQQQADLRLDAIQLIRERFADQPAQSQRKQKHPLVERVTASDDERMPPADEGERLTQQQVRMLELWIESGMPGPEHEETLSSPADHWAYQPILRPNVPQSDQANSKNPIDAFITAAQRDVDLQPGQRADPQTLLRRVSLGVIGLPPTVQQVETFALDSSQAAYESKVEQLLNNPQYGERWGRHWMDVWRYSDWSGYKNQLRGSQRHIWRWRDWIVESLNADKPYGQMIIEMLAGDELAPLDPDVLRATGFLARNYHNSNRNIWLDATVEHTAKAFLGMTINCARCHDHKFDPIPQQEYYTVRAIFEPHHVRTDRVPGQRDLNRDGLARVFDKDLEAKTFLYQRGNEKFPDEEHPLDPAVVSVLGLPFDVQPIELPITSRYPALSKAIRDEELKRTQQAVEEADRALSQFSTAASNGMNDRSTVPPAPQPSRTITVEHQLAQLKFLAAQAAHVSLSARYAADEFKFQSDNPDQSRIDQLSRQAATAEREAHWLAARHAALEKWHALQTARTSDNQDVNQQKAAIAAAQKAYDEARQSAQKLSAERSRTDANYTPVGDRYPSHSTGRRLALAQWIVHPDNPLTARVAVNHLWMRHFGTPLVENVFDFGLRSPRPLHADLLDFLASELIESGWSMKHLHRLILTSHIYQQSSYSDAATVAHNAAIDPDNRYYWRTNTQRLEAEVIRDSMLFVSGQLDVTLGGPDIDFEQGEEVPRRSLYFRHAYEKQMLMMTIFDAASPNECYRRSPSIIPQQALALSNSPLSFRAARRLAESLEAQKLAPRERIEQGFLRVLSRSPTAAELAACTEFLSSDDQVSLENLMHVLLNHNDFVSVR